MTPLNETATGIFNQLLEKLKGHEHIKLLSDGYMALSFEIIGRLNTTFGSGNAYSLMHYFTQNGDLMRDPEMCFLDLPEEPGNLFTGVYVYCYQLDNMGIYQESFVFGPNGMLEINVGLQQQHADFAIGWLTNIQQQGFLK
jgi:hypothetical protein